MIKTLVMLLSLLFVVPNPAHAVIETYEFDNDEQRALYHKMVRELRCVVCQNQNLVESNAPIARDLRRQLYQMIRYQHADEAQIIDFMTARYGDFVLYRPPLQANTLLLWFAPLILFILAILAVIQFVRQSQTSSTSTRQEDEWERS